MPQISIGVAVGFPHHVTQRENYQECVSEDKDEGNVWGVLEITLEETS